MGRPDTINEYQIEKESLFLAYFSYNNQHLLSNSESESKDHFIEKRKIELQEEFKEKVRKSTFQRILMNQEVKAKRYSKIEIFH